MDTSRVCVHNLIHSNYSSVDKNLPSYLLVVNGTAKKIGSVVSNPCAHTDLLKIDEFRTISMSILFCHYCIFRLMEPTMLWETGKRNALPLQEGKYVHHVQMRDIGSFRMCFNVSKIHVQVRNVLMLPHRFI